MIEFGAKTENEFLSDFFLNWNEIAAKTENEIPLENFLKLGMNLRSRQKMIRFWTKFAEVALFCG